MLVAGRGGVRRRVGRLVLSLAAAGVTIVLALRVVAPPVTTLMAFRAVEALAAGRRPTLTRRWIPLATVPPTLLRTVLAAEDARFFSHAGVDVHELLQAWRTRRPGRPPRGASTITMQCARSVFLWPSRSYVRKALEIPLAGLLELAWGKRRILEVYVNVVEWGDGLYGVEAAAQRYFGVPAARLTPPQAALLVAALPNPRRRNPAAPTPALSRRAAIIGARATRVRLDPLASSPHAATTALAAGS